MFSADVRSVASPERFTWPFHYAPHALARLAAGEVQREVAGHSDWMAELSLGKMLGVLVVETGDGVRGFLAAYSGSLCGRNDHGYFVPPVYDLLRPDGEFRRGEAEITAMNHQIAALLQSERYADLRQQLESTKRDREHAVARYRAFMAESKAARHAERQAGPLSPERAEELLNQSRHQNAEFKRLRQRHDALVDEARHQLAAFETRIEALKRQRKVMSEDLQRRIFSLFVVRNARGGERTLLDVFAPALPPAGAGECCAPKLLQYAYARGYKPVCVAEFWVGASPSGEVRHEGCFYPACRSKCYPILSYMMEGLDVDPNPLAASAVDSRLEVVYEDPWIVVADKPSGLLVEPGTVSDDNIVVRFKRQFPAAAGPVIVHRLDQETSGLIILAKSKAAHKAFQALFADREVEKTYEAVVEGIVEADAGAVDLPLRPDVDDRPRQMVDPIHGKPAMTRFEVVERTDGRTRLRLWPKTGRTHQLRVHLSHALGLGTPIVGDSLYGTAGARLHLHAARLRFVHPFTGRPVELCSAPPF